MTNLDPKVEVAHRLCDDLTKDVGYMTNKQWMIPAIVSHISVLLGVNKDIIEPRVNSWYQKKVRDERIL